jgi:phage FluMu protein Com
MIDIFDNKELDLNNIVCHSGGAVGSDTEWEVIGQEFGVKTRAYSYKTPKHESVNKVEISEEDYKEGVEEINKANKWLNRYGIHKYMNLLARNWAQVKYSDEVIAIGYIVKKGEKNPKGYYNKGKFDMVDGGTGYACQMAINHQRPVYVFDQIRDKWFRWSYSSLCYVECKCPKITHQNFAGIGTREIKPNGIQAIRDVFNKTFLK